MEIILNYFFYCTWKTQIFISQFFIEKPLVYLFHLVPYLQKNWNKGKGEYNKIMHNTDSGLGLGLSFMLMTSQTAIIYASFCLFVVKIFNIEVGDNLKYYFIGVLVLSFLTNQMLIYRADTYKKYFKKFEKIKNKSLVHFSALLFHLVVWLIGIISVVLTVGFKFK